MRIEEIRAEIARLQKVQQQLLSAGAQPVEQPKLDDEPPPKLTLLERIQAKGIKPNRQGRESPIRGIVEKEYSNILDAYGEYKNQDIADALSEAYGFEMKWTNIRFYFVHLAVERGDIEPGSRGKKIKRLENGK